MMTTMGILLAAMAALAVIEAVVPLRALGRWGRVHRGPNLALTALTFTTNAVLNTAVVLLLAWLDARGVGVLHAIALPPLAMMGVVVLALDGAAYGAHVSMHMRPGWWRFHAVHHADPALDVTTSFRQHPGESAIRYAFAAVTAGVLGVSPGAFAVYRLWSALNALLEHANIRLPRRLDGLLVLVITTPDMHKVHHSRSEAETNSNYGNIFSLFDRLFSTFTPSARGPHVTYGLDGFDDEATQTAARLLALPFRDVTASPGIVAEARLSGL